MSSVRVRSELPTSVTLYFTAQAARVQRLFATLEWVHWFSTRRLLGPIGYVPPAEHDANYHAARGQLALPGLN